MCGVTAPPGTGGRRSTPAKACATGRRPGLAGGSGTSPRRRPGCCPLTWCDPYAWIPEAARLLRPGGQLIFLVNSVLMMLTVPDAGDLPATDRLLRPHFGMHRFEWPDDESVEFHLGHGDMVRLLRRCGLVVEDLLELRPPPGATTRYPYVTLGWSRRWPCEEVWKARKPS
jgi:hypothetical protein